jgi:hypothetical protein
MADEAEVTLEDLKERAVRAIEVWARAADIIADQEVVTYLVVSGVGENMERETSRVFIATEPAMPTWQVRGLMDDAQEEFLAQHSLDEDDD